MKIVPHVFRDTRLLNIIDVLNDECQCVLIVSHSSKKEDHLWNQVTTLANIIRL